jgi:ribosome-binding factor A
MKSSHKGSQFDLRSLCAEVRPEDGLPPHRTKTNAAKAPHVIAARQQQYCKAVLQALDAGLANVCGDHRLKHLLIQSVQVMPHGSKLLVLVETPDQPTSAAAEIETALQRASGLLRSIVAGEIQRKRTPALVFRVVPPNP